MILHIKIYKRKKKKKKKNIENNTQKHEIWMNNINYINTLKRKRNEQFSDN